MDEVFKALADPTRRGLLDELFRQDGQTLSELEGRLPMTRFGVMKHLRVLEDAGLVATRRRGREKLHFLNPVPIRLIHDRWVSKYAEPWAAALSGAQARARGADDGAGLRDLHQDDTGALWEAITDPKLRAQYSFGVETHSDWTPGSAYEAGPPAGSRSRAARTSRSTRRAGSCRPTRRAGATTSRPRGPRVTWEIEPVGDSCRLVLIHDRLPEDANAELYGGWPMILSGLKTLLETGESLTTPGSLMYS